MPSAEKMTCKVTTVLFLLDKLPCGCKCICDEGITAGVVFVHVVFESLDLYISELFCSQCSGRATAAKPKKECHYRPARQT